jgi:chromosome segregation ATPase
MALDETIRAVNCSLLLRRLDRAKAKLAEQTNLLRIFERDVRIEENQLRNLRDQQTRTGDREGFAQEIFEVERRINRLKDDIDRAESRRRIASHDVSNLKNQIDNHSCPEPKQKKTRSIDRAFRILTD